MVSGMALGVQHKRSASVVPLAQGGLCQHPGLVADDVELGLLLRVLLRHLTLQVAHDLIFLVFVHLQSQVM
jgi:hypothetical protein